MLFDVDFVIKGMDSCGYQGQVVIVIFIVIFEATCLLTVGSQSLYAWKSLEVTINKRGALCSTFKERTYVSWS